MSEHSGFSECDAADKAITDLQQQLAATTEYANVLRVQLAAVVSARDEACKMLDWIDARYLPPGMTTYRLLELLAAGKEDK